MEGSHRDHPGERGERALYLSVGAGSEAESEESTPHGASWDLVPLSDHEDDFHANGSHGYNGVSGQRRRFHELLEPYGNKNYRREEWETPPLIPTYIRLSSESFPLAAIAPNIFILRAPRGQTIPGRATTPVELEILIKVPVNVLGYVGQTQLRGHGLGIFHATRTSADNDKPVRLVVQNVTANEKILRRGQALAMLAFLPLIDNIAVQEETFGGVVDVEESDWATQRLTEERRAEVRRQQILVLKGAEPGVREIGESEDDALIRGYMAHPWARQTTSRAQEEFIRMPNDTLPSLLLGPISPPRGQQTRHPERVNNGWGEQKKCMYHHGESRQTLYSSG